MGRITSPDENVIYGTVAVAATVFLSAYAPNYGSVFILIFYAIWLPLVLTDYRSVIGNPSRLYWVLGFAIFACVSFAWSQVPELSLRGSLQYLSTIICALIASRVISVRTMISGLGIGVAVVLVYSLLFGQFSYDPLDGRYSFVGAFGSKNQLGLYASLGAYSGLASFFVMRSRIASRSWSAFSCAFALFCLSASQSAASAITLAVAIAAVFAAMFLRRFAPRHRTGFFLVLVPLGVLTILIGASAGLFNVLLNMFGKDATLTGRTYLWQRGLEIARENPILGEGFQGFWVQGFSRAEILWDQFYIPSRAGFHFHNTYIETMVELGYVGLFLLSVILISLLAGQLKRLLAAGSCREDVVMLGFTILFISRSFVEIDFLNQYTIGSFLIYYAAGLIARPIVQAQAKKKTGAYAMSLRPV
jgi:exopolysaccharide production protein ExoQ